MRYRILAAAAVILSINSGAQELTGIVQLRAGENRACVLTDTGSVKCWGRAPLGDGGTADRWIAAQIFGLESGVVEIGVGPFHACAVLATGAIKCWGANNFGQLGDGTTVARNTPVDVLNLPGPAIAVAPGWGHSCALLASGGVHCWGDNARGQLGGNALTGNIVAIAGEANHACALTSGGGVKCWGANEAGQLGDGTTTDRATPADVQGLGTGVAFIAAGSGPTTAFGVGGGTSCAITMQGNAKCWGSMYSASSSEPSEHLTPFDVPGLTSGAATLAIGSFGYSPPGSRQYYTQATNCATTTSGAALCWGFNAYGSLGRGVSGNEGVGWPHYGKTEPIPAQVVNLGSGVASTAAGGMWACALLANGRVQCWGENYDDNGVGFPQPISAGMLPQAITVNGPHEPLAIGAQRSVSGTGGGSNNALVFTSLTPATCSASGSQVSPGFPSGPQFTTAQVTGLAQGLCTIAANQPGNANWAPAPQVTFTFRIGDPVPQTITFGAAPTVPVNGVGSLIATASSGLAVTFSSNTPSICSVSGNTVTGIAVGNCTVAASQAGDITYAPAPQTTQTFPVTANAGTSPLRVSRAGLGTGTVSSTPAGINCGAECAGNFGNSSQVTLTATAGTNSEFDRWEGACTGSGACTVSMTGAMQVTAYFRSTVPRLINLSTRGMVQTGDGVMIGGFIIGGSAPKTVLVRARGPSLAQSGVPGVLPDPRLTLFSGQTQIGMNGNWQDSINRAAIEATGFAPSNVWESAILMTLAPGAYTSLVEGEPTNNSVLKTGIAIVEVFEVNAVESPLINISTRGPVQTGDGVMIGGFIVQGSAPTTVLVRVRGPSLAQAGVPGVLANPGVELYSGQTLLASNDDWQQAPNTAAIIATGNAPPDANESAILMSLAPGAYTAIVRGVGNTTGIGIVEMYAVP